MTLILSVSHGLTSFSISNRLPKSMQQMHLVQIFQRVTAIEKLKILGGFENRSQFNIRNVRESKPHCCLLTAYSALHYRYINECPCRAFDCCTWANILHWLQGTHASKLNVIVTDKKFMAENKHSISPLGDTLLYLQRKWKDNLSGCSRTAGLNLIISPTYCESEFDLFISAQTNNLISSTYGLTLH